MTIFDDIKIQYPIAEYFANHGVEIPSGNQVMACCPFHNDRTPSLSISRTTGEWNCFGCGEKGSVIQAMMKIENLTEAEVVEKYGKENTLPPSPTMNRPPPPPLFLSPEPTQSTEEILVAEYKYFNSLNEHVFSVYRYDPKDFRQKRVKPDGTMDHGMGDIDRVLYNLPNVLNANEIWVVEGEADVDALHEFENIVATTSPGGAGKWLDSYSEAFQGKKVILCPDNDEPGAKHADMVRKSIAPYAKWIKQVSINKPAKDIRDYLESGGDIKELLKDVPKLYQGIDLGISSMYEVEERYRALSKLGDVGLFNLGKWLPSMRECGSLFPGDLAILIGGTGAGKSAVLQGIAAKARPLKVLYFQLELTERQMIGRQKGMAQSKVESVVWHEYKKGRFTSPEPIDHIYLSTESTLTPKQLESKITHSELKIGGKPDVVILDYLQLMTADGSGSRYEKFSNIAESLKRVAKSTDTILIVASQTQRPTGGGETVIGLHSAKESGSIENSATLVFGIERPAEDRETAIIVVVKYTRGIAGKIINCNFNNSLKITERAKT